MADSIASGDIFVYDCVNGRIDFLPPETLLHHLLLSCFRVINVVTPAIIIVGHMSKGEKSKWIYRGLGSIDITAAARSIFLVGKRNGDTNTRFMTQIKNNLVTFGKAFSFTMEGSGKAQFLGECDIAEEDLLSTTIYKQSKFEITLDVYGGVTENMKKKSAQRMDNFIKSIS